MIGATVNIISTARSTDVRRAVRRATLFLRCDILSNLPKIYIPLIYPRWRTAAFLRPSSPFLPSLRLFCPSRHLWIILRYILTYFLLLVNSFAQKNCFQTNKNICTFSRHILDILHHAYLIHLRRFHRRGNLYML